MQVRGVDGILTMPDKHFSGGGVSGWSTHTISLMGYQGKDLNIDFGRK